MARFKNTSTMFTALCCLIYFTSYITRINFGAVISEICVAEGFIKSAVAIVTTCSFVSYGVGQVFSGYLGEKVKPHLLISGGLLATSVANVLIPFCKEIYQMAILWFFNGFFQSLMWPPLVKIISKHSADNDAYNKTTTAVSTSSAIATVVIYFASPLCINIGGWRTVFYVSALIGAVVAIIWQITYLKMPEPVNRVSSEKTATQAQFDKTGVIIVATMSIAIILQGMLRDGITTWLPSIMAETYNVSESSAIFSTVVLPVMTIISINLASFIQRKFFKEELFCAFLFFIVGFAASLILSFVYGKTSMGVLVVLASVTSAMMHSANIMLIVMTIPGFKRFGVSFMSGLLNSMTYIGSASATYLFPKISEVFGGNWNITIYSWVIFAFAGAAICFAIIPTWKKFKVE